MGTNNLKPGNASLSAIAPLYALVRDKNGRPKIDDGNTIPQWAKDALLEEHERMALAANRYCYRPRELPPVSTTHNTNPYRGT